MVPLSASTPVRLSAHTFDLILWRRDGPLSDAFTVLNYEVSEQVK